MQGNPSPSPPSVLTAERERRGDGPELAGWRGARAAAPSGDGAGPVLRLAAGEAGWPQTNAGKRGVLPCPRIGRPTSNGGWRHAPGNGGGRMLWRAQTAALLGKLTWGKQR